MEISDVRLDEAWIEGRGRAPSGDDPRTLRIEATLGAWRISYDVTTQRGRPVIARLEFLHADDELPPGGLPSTLVRSVSLERLISAAAELLALETAIDATGTLATFGPLERRPGRRPSPDLRYARVASRYVELVRAGNGRPIQTIARELKEPNPNFVRDLVVEARRRGLLTRPVGGPGRAGGELTGRAEALLAEAQNQPPRRRKRPGA